MTKTSRFVHYWPLPVGIDPDSVEFKRLWVLASRDIDARAADVGLRLVGPVRWSVNDGRLVGRATAVPIDQEDAA